jgi:hypothetical protein
MDRVLIRICPPPPPPPHPASPSSPLLPESRVHLQTHEIATAQVCTAQYFVWFLSLLPIVAPHSRMSAARGFALCAAFFAGELHWLLWGYRLEFLGESGASVV